MEYLFPCPTPFENNENSFINLSFNTIYSMEYIIKQYEEELEKKNKKKRSWIKIIIIMLLLISRKFL